MSRRSLVESARVGGIAVVGGFIAGVSLFALTVAPSSSTVFTSRDAMGLDRVQVLNGVSLPACTKSTSIVKIDANNEDLGTLGAGLNCTGAPRSVCARAN
jgi:hypothetical protein